MSRYFEMKYAARNPAAVPMMPIIKASRITMVVISFEVTPIERSVPMSTFLLTTEKVIVL
jgi:hypothetical protein